MRASEQGATGDRGETAVAAKFQSLKWAVAVNPKSADVGTDLWLMARDERRFDLGLLVGAQVKTSAGDLSRPHRDGDGKLLGWWWYERDREHVDAWLAHSVPHLLIRHSLGTGATHWAHITSDAVISTGKGVKILIPVDNTIDESCREKLASIAAAPRQNPIWEGSAWTGAAEIFPAALARYAMIVPRVIAPHPNRGVHNAITPAQGLAMIVQARFVEFEYYAEEHSSVPDLDSAGDADSWDWRLVGAMSRRMLHGDTEPLVGLGDIAPDPARRVAAVVAAAAALMEDGLPESALSLLEPALERDDAEPVDHGWLLAQAARAYADIGRVDDARALAAQVQEVGLTHGDDPTAMAIAGAAAILLFVTADWGAADLASTVVAGDTVSAWWQNQTLVTGLTAALRREFGTWSQEKDTIRFGADDALNKLASAAVTASLVGDQGTWRHYAVLLAQVSLLRVHRTSPPDDVTSALSELRLSGESEGIVHAIRRLKEDGPCTAIASAARAIDLARSTRTTARSDLALLRVGGDLVDSPTAEKSARWLLETINDSRDFNTRTGCLITPERLIDTLAGVIGSASLTMQQTTARHIAMMPAQNEYSLAQSWAKVVAQLPQEAWSDDALERIGESTPGHHENLAIPLGGLDSRRTESRAELLDALRTGSLSALAAIGDVTQIPTPVAEALIEHLAARIRENIEDAHKGAYGMGDDVGKALALLNVWHPEVAVWDPLVQLIGDPLTHPSHKIGALGLLANQAGMIPEHKRRILCDAARAAAEHPGMPGPFPGRTDSSPEAGELVASLQTLINDETGEQDTELVRLVGGSVDARVSAAHIARRRGQHMDVGVLLVLTQDDDPSVRGAAAFSLARLVIEGVGGEAARAALKQACDDPGRQAPLAVAAALGSREDLAADLEQLRTRLAGHASSAVRRTARGCR